MAKKDSQGNWLDDRGQAVPEKYIPAIDKKRDALVESIIKSVVKLSEKMATEKVKIVASIDKYLDELQRKTRSRKSGRATSFSRTLTRASA